jgi:ParB family chromosome partitioning protein
LSGTYEIIAGERRWRASKMAGLSEIPVVILDGDDLKAAQVSIIENVQRENLNPVEEALAYRTLMDRFDLTQDQVSQQVGKSRSNIANMMRLLDLPDNVLDLLREGLISTGHARALLALEREEDIPALAERIMQAEMSVREVEKAVKLINAALHEEPKMETAEDTAETNLRRVHIRDLEHRILEKMGRKVKITNSDIKKVVELSYDNDEDLEELLKALCGDDFFAEGN